MIRQNRYGHYKPTNIWEYIISSTEEFALLLLLVCVWLMTLVTLAFAHITPRYADPINNGVIDYNWPGAGLDPAPTQKEHFEHWL